MFAGVSSDAGAKPISRNDTTRSVERLLHWREEHTTLALFDEGVDARRPSSDTGELTLGLAESSSRSPRHPPCTRLVLRGPFLFFMFLSNEYTHKRISERANQSASLYSRFSLTWTTAFSRTMAHHAVPPHTNGSRSEPRVTGNERGHERRFFFFF